MKKRFYSEISYLLGIVILALGTAFMTKADVGLSMVVAPAYLLHLELSGLWPWFTFGVAEYTCQALLLVVMCLVLQRFRIGYLMSFVTAFFYGTVLDGCMWLVKQIAGSGMGMRVACFVVGEVLCAVGVAFVLHTYIAPEVYELFVKEWADKYGKPISICKTIYDCVSLAVAVVMSFAFFGLWHFEGIGVGTLICAVVNGWMIGKISAVLEQYFIFERGIPQIDRTFKK